MKTTRAEITTMGGNLCGPKELMVQTNTERDSMCRVEILNPFSLNYRSAAVPPLALSAVVRSELSKRSLHIASSSLLIDYPRQTARRFKR